MNNSLKRKLDAVYCGWKESLRFYEELPRSHPFFYVMDEVTFLKLWPRLPRTEFEQILFQEDCVALLMCSDENDKDMTAYFRTQLLAYNNLLQTNENYIHYYYELAN